MTAIAMATIGNAAAVRVADASALAWVWTALAIVICAWAKPRARVRSGSLAERMAQFAPMMMTLARLRIRVSRVTMAPPADGCSRRVGDDGNLDEILAGHQNQASGFV